MKPILDATRDELAAWCAAAGQPAFRARSLRDAILRRRAASFDAMTDLPKAFRAKLAEEWTVFGSTILSDVRDAETGAGKLLLRLVDGKTIECVLLMEEDRRTVCLSTQVGCAMGCVFCASGLEGVDRNLSTGELLEQLVLLRNLLPEGERLSHIVVMGMGEPLANLDNLLAALEVAIAPDGLGIGQRHITISTVGLPAKMLRLADSGRQYHLAVSLHAPNQWLRERIVPTARKVAYEDVLGAADEFRRRTGRQVTFEYVLLGGINDHPDHAMELADRLAGRDCFVNLIPFNPVAGLDFRTPPTLRSNLFATILRDAGLAVRIRKRKGQAIDAACGQLRRSKALDVVTIAPAATSWAATP